MNPRPFFAFGAALAVALTVGCQQRAPGRAAGTRVAAVAPASAPATPALPAPNVAPAEPAGEELANLFAATSWLPAQRPPAPAPPRADPLPPAAPAAPAAPPLPFRFVGRYGDADSNIVMLAKGDRLYLVSPGDTFEQLYRLERASGNTVELTYLPLNLKQSLSTGDAR